MRGCAGGQRAPNVSPLLGHLGADLEVLAYYI